MHFTYAHLHTSKVRTQKLLVWTYRCIWYTCSIISILWITMISFLYRVHIFDVILMYVSPAVTMGDFCGQTQPVEWQVSSASRGPRFDGSAPGQHGSAALNAVLLLWFLVGGQITLDTLGSLLLVVFTRIHGLLDYIYYFFVGGVGSY